MNFWFVVPAAGLGKRFGGPLPKQYCVVAGKTIIEHTLTKLLTLNPRGIVVAIADGDSYWPSLEVSQHPLISVVSGGAERAHSVLNSLRFLRNEIHDEDWVLVHDVARPCLLTADVKNMLAQLADSPAGGILATPVSDTLKVVCDGQVESTIDRSNLWSAMTPQMFRFGALYRALSQSERVTDEAAAMEMAGFKPIVIEGSRDNIKITRPEDIVIAEAILQGQIAGQGAT